jgi:hypothetical protein
MYPSHWRLDQGVLDAKQGVQSNHAVIVAGSGRDARDSGKPQVVASMAFI